jgi:hypothetical protein
LPSQSLTPVDSGSGDLWSSLRAAVICRCPTGFVVRVCEVPSKTRGQGRTDVGRSRSRMRCQVAMRPARAASRRRRAQAASRQVEPQYRRRAVAAAGRGGRSGCTCGRPWALRFRWSKMVCTKKAYTGVGRGQERRSAGHNRPASGLLGRLAAMAWAAERLDVARDIPLPPPPKGVEVIDLDG